ncbi:MAG: bifunctional pyr operon transcriptional regulator/uracil phosphoribosyltransferase PyrR [Desulfobacterales bacterium]|nr:bifunctional pyr operon transcriptional regulator/uracil phosphoribosyltransferase PyrR [Desulfobacterales bacterium]
MKAEKTIISTQDIKRVLTRMAHEIIEVHKGVENLAIIGIQTRGDYLAKRLEQIIKDIEGTSLPVGDMDINLYRDDWTKISHHPIVKPSNIPFNVDEKNIILVDDVLYTGRTIRAAMDALMDFGRPSQIELAVLVDRGHRELPIQADYKGIFIDTDKNDMVNVCLKEHDNEDRVYIAQD